MLDPKNFSDLNPITESSIVSTDSIFIQHLDGGSPGLDKFYKTTIADIIQKNKDAIVPGGGPAVETSRLVSTQHSLTGGGDLSADRTLSLLNDEASPGNSKMYGTNGSGVKGWYAQPTSAAWGSITGTLSSQTDLNSAINAKAALTQVVRSDTTQAVTAATKLQFVSNSGVYSVLEYSLLDLLGMGTDYIPTNGTVYAGELPAVPGNFYPVEAWFTCLASGIISNGITIAIAINTTPASGWGTPPFFIGEFNSAGDATVTLFGNVNSSLEFNANLAPGTFYWSPGQSLYFRVATEDPLGYGDKAYHPRIVLKGFFA